MSTISTKTTSKLVKRESQVELPPHRKQLMDMVIANLQKGNIPWHRGWSADDFPKNAITNKEYRGVNYLLLSMMPYSDNRWCSFLQAKDKGWKIKKGAKAHRLNYTSTLICELAKKLTGIKSKRKPPKCQLTKSESFSRNTLGLCSEHTSFSMPSKWTAFPNELLSR